MRFIITPSKNKRYNYLLFFLKYINKIDWIMQGPLTSSQSTDTNFIINNWL